MRRTRSERERSSRPGSIPPAERTSQRASSGLLPFTDRSNSLLYWYLGHVICYPRRRWDFHIPVDVTEGDTNPLDTSERNAHLYASLPLHPPPFAKTDSKARRQGPRRRGAAASWATYPEGATRPARVCIRAGIHEQDQRRYRCWKHLSPAGGGAHLFAHGCEERECAW